MPVRFTFLISFTTDPTDRTQAAGHSGGWSESFYFPDVTSIVPKVITPTAQARANLLPRECTIDGWRAQIVTISKNKLLPGGTSSGAIGTPGNQQATLGGPWNSLMVYFGLNGQPTTVRHRLAQVPDVQVADGEYQPSPAYQGLVTRYINQLVAVGASAIGRDLANNADSRVVSLDGAVLTTQSPTGAAAGDYIILRRVRDDDGFPVVGSFLVTAVATVGATTQYTLFAPPAQTVSTPNGTCRKDALVLSTYTGGTPARLVNRKMGRPFVQYRGRRSKRRG